MLLTLEQWAKARYSKPPHMKTLRRWAREAKIVPVPKKNGRTYYVEEDARYIDWRDLSESQETHSA